MTVLALISAHWKSFVEILILWYVIYMTFVFVKGTRTAQLLKGLIILFIVFAISKQLGLEIITWLMTRLFAISVIMLLVIFQPELRRGLARLGQFGVYQENVEILDELVKAAITLSKKRIGTLIAIEREIGLKNYIETGSVIDAKVATEIIISLFLQESPVHDGGMVIQEGRIAAAGCLFPLAQLTQISRSLGTRHRAALGLSEETDAIIIVVSEETGEISVALNGHFSRDFNESNLLKFLQNIFYKQKKRKSILKKSE